MPHEPSTASPPSQASDPQSLETAPGAPDLEEVFETYFDRIWNFAWHFGRTRRTTEALVHGIFRSLRAELTEPMEPAALTPWVYGIAVRHLEAARGEPSRSRARAEHPADASTASRLLALPWPDRLLVVLRASEGLTVQQISQVLGREEHMVEQGLRNAAARLRGASTGSSASSPFQGAPNRDQASA